jgi:hypothetical protein
MPPSISTLHAIEILQIKEGFKMDAPQKKESSISGAEIQAAHFSRSFCPKAINLPPGMKDRRLCLTKEKLRRCFSIKRRRSFPCTFSQRIR